MAFFSSINAWIGKYIDIVDNLAALRAYNVSHVKNGDAVLVSSESTIGDARGGAFVWSAISTELDDNKDVIRPSQVALNGKGRWTKMFGAGPAGAIGPDGNPGPMGPQGNPGGSVEAAGSFTGLRTGAVVIPTGVERVRSSFHTVKGFGAADYILNSTLTDAQVAAHPRATFAARNSSGTVTRWMIDTSKDWHYEAFGALPFTGSQAPQFDCSDAFDAIQALNKFLRSANLGYVPGRKIVYGAAEYFHSRPQNNQALFNHTGQGAGSSGSGWNTALVFATNTMGVVINSHNTNYDQVTAGDYSSAAASGTSYENLMIRSLGGTDVTKHGVWARDRVNLIDMKVVGFPGDNIHIVGHSNRLTPGTNLDGGNVNDWQINRVVVQASGRHGVYLEGFDCNAGHSVSLEVLSAGCGGIVDNSFLGNTHTAPVVHGCGDKGDGRVSFNGRHYYLIVASGGGTVTPGTNDNVWYDVGAGTSFPAWVSGKNYTFSGGLFTQGSVSRTIVSGGYLEVGATGLSHTPAPAIVMLGEGTTEFTDYSNVVSATTGGGLSSKLGVGGFRYSRTPAEVAAWGAHLTASFGAELSRVGGAFTYLKAENSFEYRTKFLAGGRGIWHDYANLIPMMWNMMNGVAEKFGKTNSVVANDTPKTAFPFGIILNYNQDAGRVISAASDIPDGNGDNAVGEFVFTSRPDAYGAIGFACTSATQFGNGSVTKKSEWAKAGPLFLTGEVVAAIGSVAVGACSPIFTITVPGAKVGNAVIVSLENGTKGLQMVGWVDSDNTAKFYASNPAGSPVGTVALANQYCYVKVIK
jgi:hypothetical protein